MSSLDPRMGAFDAVMWGVEEDPLLRSVITMVVELDGPPDPAILEERVERMSLANEKLRRRAIGNPLSLLPPRWEVDPNFDFHYHLRWTRLPESQPGLAEVLQYAEVISEQDFDRARPLWEIHVITGLAEGHSAVIVKIHHSITDGVGGMQMAATLFDVERIPSYELGPKPAKPRGAVANFSDRIKQAVTFETQDVLEDVKTAAALSTSYARKVVSDPVSTAFNTQQFMASAGRLLAPSSEPMSDLWTERSLGVAFSVIEAPLDALKAAAKAVGASLNDAFVAAVIGGVAAYHHEYGSHPSELRMHMPINVRAAADANSGNRWIPARFPVPLNVGDASDRIRQLRPILEQARLEPALGLSDAIYKLLTVMPRPLTTQIAGGLMKGTDFVATNVPGPPIPVYLAGTEVLSMVPFAPKGGAAVNVGLMSYNGQMFLGVNVDVGAVEHPEEFAQCLAASLSDVIAVGQPDS